MALKVIAPEYARESFRQRFERESRHVASIDHPHVVPIYEADEADSLLYLIMRYVDGPISGRSSSVHTRGQHLLPRFGGGLVVHWHLGLSRRSDLRRGQVGGEVRTTPKPPRPADCRCWPR